MGVEFKLTDHELPVSPAFVRFLAQWLSGRGFDGEVWPDQLSEALSAGEADAPRQAAEAAELVMRQDRGRELLGRSYSLLCALLTGDLTGLHELHARFHFIGVIGVPRSGGSYLTAELYRALGMSPERVPGALAHDSFPATAPFELQPGSNSWVLALKTMAEYLTMVEVFFADQKPFGGKIVVPKKLTQGAYAGGFYHRLLGDGAEYLLTVRHPAAACMSTYEKSGGLPAHSRFRVRSNIEEWCRRDLHHIAGSSLQLEHSDYFATYLRYWEHYHLQLATSGLSASRRLRVIGYGPGSLPSVAQTYHSRFGSGRHAAAFHVSDRARQVHPDWLKSAEPAIGRVAAVWQQFGIHFPIDEIVACW